MPVRGAKVHRGPWFRAVLAELQRLGFSRCEPPNGLMLSPGFYHFCRGEYRVQILPRNTIQVTRPSGKVTTDGVPDFRAAKFVLDALELAVEFGEDS
jgi:hypothetical protein